MADGFACAENILRTSKPEGDDVLSRKLVSRDLKQIVVTKRSSTTSRLWARTLSQSRQERCLLFHKSKRARPDRTCA
jgi:hypothetical protein